MQVVKRNGEKEQVKFEKILKRIQRQSKDLKHTDSTEISQKVIGGIFDGVTSLQLDELAIDTAYSNSIKHPEYDKLALRLAVTALHKTTEPNFVAAMDKLQTNQDKLGRPQPILSDVVYKFIKKNASVLDATIDHNRDFLFDYFGFKTLSKAYLLRMNGKIIERPQYMWMRVACGIHFDDIEAAIQTYHLLSKLQATHATPTLFNSGKTRNQTASCFLKSLNDDQDSIKGMYDAMSEVAQLSKYAGGIGVHIHDVRSKGQDIYSTGGISDGIIPMLRVWNEEARHVNQSGKRKGSFAFYLEPWHSDIFEFLDLRKNNGKEELRARDLFTAIWAPDLFFKKVEADDDWYLMDPYLSPGLSEVYDETEEGGSFTNLYNKYVLENKYIKKIKARELWQAMLVSMIETGTPYLLAKDACNRKSNQKNLGTIKSSNLCLASETKVWVKDAIRNGFMFLTGPEWKSQEYDIQGEPYQIQIKDLVEKYKSGKQFFVKSFDIEKNEIVWSFVINAGKTKENAETIELNFHHLKYRDKNLDKILLNDSLEFEEGKLICTENHKIFSMIFESSGNLEYDFVEAENFSPNAKFLLGKYSDEKNFTANNEASFSSRIKNTNKQDVYDLTVEKTSCFFANDILVHNCAEIIEYSSPTETAVCNLASISLPSFVKGRKNKSFDFEKLEEVTKILIENLNKTVDNAFYPIESAKNSNLKHRPIGLGIQGLADTFALMRYSWESEDAKDLNKQIAETIYYSSIKTSCELAKKYGSYETFKGSPLSEGKFQFNFWGFEPSNRYDWKSLRKDVMKYGVRNSLTTAEMPTASTSQLLGNTESFEVITSNLYKRQTLSGEFIQINKYLVDDLMELNLWNDEMRQKIIAADGSIQNISEIPDNIKQLYKTVWELSQKIIIDFAADRGPFIDQSQSMNLYLKDINIAKLSSALFYAWKKGLKTLVYYTRNTASRESIKLIADKKIENETTELAEGIACSLDNPEACEMCSA